jgi:hypothetical protein
VGKGPDEKFCSECGTVIKLKAVICPACGCEQAGAKPTAAATSSVPASGPLGTGLRLIAALAIGGACGFLIYMELCFVFTDQHNPPGAAFVLLGFFGSWALVTRALMRESRTLSRVLARGCLALAAVWMAMIPAGVILSAKAAASTGAKAGAEMAGAGIGAGLASVLTGGVSVAMAGLCLFGFVVFHLLSRELKTEA